LKETASTVLQMIIKWNGVTVIPHSHPTQSNPIQANSGVILFRESAIFFRSFVARIELGRKRLYDVSLNVKSGRPVGWSKVGGKGATKSPWLSGFRKKNLAYLVGRGWLLHGEAWEDRRER